MTPRLAAGYGTFSPRCNIRNQVPCRQPVVEHAAHGAAGEKSQAPQCRAKGRRRPARRATPLDRERFLLFVSAKTLTRVCSESQIHAADFHPAKLAPFGSRSAIDSGFRGTRALCRRRAQTGNVRTNFAQGCKNYDNWLTGPNPRLYCAPFQVKGAFRDFSDIDGHRNSAILKSLSPGLCRRGMFFKNSNR